MEWVTPMPDSLRTEVERFQRALGGFSGPIFTGERNATKLMNRRVLDRWLTEAEIGISGEPLRDGGALYAPPSTQSVRRRVASYRCGGNYKLGRGSSHATASRLRTFLSSGVLCAAASTRRSTTHKGFA